MSTEDKLEEMSFEAILWRMDRGYTDINDSEWLREYYKTLQSLVEDYARQLREALDKVELEEYYRNCNE